MSSLAEVYLDRLAQFEGRKYCSVKEACRYLDLDRTTVDPLLKTRVIKNQWFGHKLCKVLVSSLIEFSESWPIDRPKPKVRT